MNKWELINADSGEKTWLTPKHIIDALGHFNTDPCCPDNMPWRTADTMLTKADDGTTAPWYGRVWLNPPYGKEAYPFLQRMTTHNGGWVRSSLCSYRYETMARMGFPIRPFGLILAWTVALLSRGWNAWTVLYYAVSNYRLFRI